MSETQDEPYLSVPEVAQRLGKTGTTIIRNIDSGGIMGAKNTAFPNARRRTFKIPVREVERLEELMGRNGNGTDTSTDPAD